jgi:hypothetical protein
MVLLFYYGSNRTLQMGMTGVSLHGWHGSCCFQLHYNVLKELVVGSLSRSLRHPTLPHQLLQITTLLMTRYSVFLLLIHVCMSHLD